MASDHGHQSPTSGEPRRTEIPRLRTPPSAAPLNHGKTKAAWTTTWLIMIGGVVVSLGFIVPSTLLIIAGAAVIVVGLVAGRILQAMGLGQHYPGTEPRRDSSSSSG